MTDVSTFEDIDMPADAVWSVIGEFGGIRKWAVLVQSETVEDTPSGKVRTLVMPEDKIVKERLVVQSQYSYTYAMVDRPDGRLSLYRRGRAAGRKAFPDRVDHAHDPGRGSDRRRDHCPVHRNLRGNLRAMKRRSGYRSDRWTTVPMDQRGVGAETSASTARYSAVAGLARLAGASLACTGD